MHTIRLGFWDSKLGGQNHCKWWPLFTHSVYWASGNSISALWVQWHSVFLQCSLTKCSVFRQFMNEHVMALPLPNQICLNTEHFKIQSGQSKFRTGWSIFFLLLEQTTEIVFIGKSASCKIVSNSLKIYWNGTTQVIFKTFKTFAELCCAGRAEGQAVLPHNVKNHFNSACCSSH